MTTISAPSAAAHPVSGSPGRWATRLLAMLVAAATGAALASAAPAPVAAPPGLSPAVGSSDERVDISLAPSILFALTDLAAGPVAAFQPFPLSFRGARLAPSRTLRISVRLETALAPGIVVSFRGRDARGGACADGTLSAATYTEVFLATGGATAGGCEAVWTLACGARVRRAGRYTVTLRWQIESVVSDRAAALAAAVRGGLPSVVRPALGPPPPAASPRSGPRSNRVPGLRPPP